MTHTKPLMAFMILGWNCVAMAVTIQDASFESFNVADGSSVMAPDGPWLWANDAGVVDPILPNSSNGAVDNTASGTFAPMDGEQYATTYATLDRVTQIVEFASAGEYELSVWAAAPDGTLTIPEVFVDRLLDTGGFQFVVDGTAIGDVNMLDPATPWTFYSTRFFVPSPGQFSVGVRNVVTAPYFINYDAFTLQTVPEPSGAMALGVLLALCFIKWTNHRQCRPQRKGPPK